MSIVWHPRSFWQDPAFPVTGPAINWSRVDTVAVHYTAADDLIDGDPGEHADDLPAYLRSIQRAYLNRKPDGYSIGYNVAVDWLGGCWELRGFDIKCAANVGHNDHTWAILVLVDGADPATVEAQAAIRDLVADAERRAGRELNVRGHCQLPAATLCPGKGLVSQIDGGVFSPRYAQSLPPIQIDPQPDRSIEEDDMQRYKDRRFANEFALPGGLTYAGEMVADGQTAGVPKGPWADLPLTVGTNDSVLNALCHANWGVDADTAVSCGYLVAS